MTVPIELKAQEKLTHIADTAREAVPIVWTNLCVELIGGITKQ